MAVQIAPQAAAGPNAGGSSVPHRAPGSPGHTQAQLPHRKTHQILPAAGQRRHPAADRRRVPGVQRRPALRSLPHLRRQDAGAGRRHHHRPDRRRRADAGRPRRLRDRVDGARARRLRHQHRRESLSRPPLRAELHPASRVAVHRTTSTSTKRGSSASTTCCSRRRCCSKPTPTSATFSFARSSPARWRRRSSTTVSVSICSSNSPGVPNTPSSPRPRRPVCRSTRRRRATARSA